MATRRTNRSAATVETPVVVENPVVETTVPTVIDLVQRAKTGNVNTALLDNIISEAITLTNEAINEVETLPQGVTLDPDHETAEFMNCLSDSFMIRVRGSRVYSDELLPESRRPFVGNIYLISTTKGKELKVLFGELTLKGVRLDHNEGSTEILASIAKDRKKLGRKFDHPTFVKEIESKFCYETILADQAKKQASLADRLQKQQALRDYDLASDVLDKYI